MERNHFDTSGVSQAEGSRTAPIGHLPENDQENGFEVKKDRDGMIRIELPLTEEIAENLHMGDNVLLSGVIYTARDAAHERMTEQLAEGIPIPFDTKDATIYYVGPSPARPGTVIGSAGPTTAGRMDKWAPQMIALGARGMIGKGARSETVVEAMKRHHGVYFGAIGGAGALLAKHIVKSELIAYEDLGPEAVRKLTVKDFPVVVLIDSSGNNLYEQGRKAYLEGYGILNNTGK